MRSRSSFVNALATLVPTCALAEAAGATTHAPKVVARKCRRSNNGCTGACFMGSAPAQRVPGFDNETRLPRFEEHCRRSQYAVRLSTPGAEELRSTPASQCVREAVF